MKEIYEQARTVTTKGQVTIPVEVRRLLKIKPQDKVVFRIVDGKVELATALMTLQEAFGSIKPRKRPEDFEEMEAIAAEERAQRWEEREER